MERVSFCDEKKCPGMRTVGGGVVNRRTPAVRSMLGRSRKERFSVRDFSRRTRADAKPKERRRRDGRHGGGPTEKKPPRDAAARKAFAETQLALMRDERLTFQKRLNAAQRACAYWEGAGSDFLLWKILAERLTLGLVNEKSVNWPQAQRMVLRLKERSTPPAGCEHVEAAYLEGPPPPCPKPAKKRGK
jgi:hypothetical protein